MSLCWKTSWVNNWKIGITNNRCENHKLYPHCECQLTHQIVYIKLLNKFVRSNQLAIDGASCRDDEQPISLNQIRCYYVSDSS